MRRSALKGHSEGPLIPARLEPLSVEPDVEIALYDWGGQGPAALLHHANGFCAATLGPLAALLRDRYRVYGMDARGHGDSSRLEDLSRYQWATFCRDWIRVAEHLVEREGGALALGIGHSLGATTTLLGASERPELVGRLALVEAVIPVRPDRRDAARLARLERLIAGAAKRRSRWPSAAAARAHFGTHPFFERWRAEALDLYVGQGLRSRRDGSVELKCPGAVEAAIFENAQGLDAYAVAETVRCPSTWVWARGGDFPRELYEGAVQRMKDARLVDVEGGHMVPMEAPERVVEAILEA